MTAEKTFSFEGSFCCNSHEVWFLELSQALEMISFSLE
jgi:hypothetical protein